MNSDRIESIEKAVNAFRLLEEMNAQLMGSRFYGTDTPDSDHDYMVLDRDGVIDELTSFGFRRIPHNEQGYEVDVCSKAIYRLPNDNFQIDVQIIKDEWHWDIKLCLSTMIRDLNIFKDIEDKNLRRHIFVNLLNAMYRLAKFGSTETILPYA